MGFGDGDALLVFNPSTPAVVVVPAGQSKEGVDAPWGRRKVHPVSGQVSVMFASLCCAPAAARRLIFGWPPVNGSVNGGFGAHGERLLSCVAFERMTYCLWKLLARVRFAEGLCMKRWLFCCYSW